jgi:hypothetical protein
MSFSLASFAPASPRSLPLAAIPQLPRLSRASRATVSDYYAIYIIRIFAAFLIPSGAGNIVTRRSCQRRIKSALIHLRTARDASPKRGTRVIGLDL